jgi:hypothetical protein
VGVDKDEMKTKRDNMRNNSHPGCLREMLNKMRFVSRISSLDESSILKMARVVNPLAWNIYVQVYTMKKCELSRDVTRYRY